LDFIIVIISVIFVVAFIIWQFKVLMKYSFHFDKFTIDTKNKLLKINNKTFYFKDINYISIEECEQPSILEKGLTKSGFYTYISEVLLHMNDGSIEKCKFNYKGTLYKFLKDIQPFVKIEEDITNFKQNDKSNFAILLILILSLLWLIFQFN